MSNDLNINGVEVNSYNLSEETHLELSILIHLKLMGENFHDFIHEVRQIEEGLTAQHLIDIYEDMQLPQNEATRIFCISNILDFVVAKIYQLEEEEEEEAKKEAEEAEENKNLYNKFGVNPSQFF